MRSHNIRSPLIMLLIAAIVALTAWAQFAPSGEPAIWTFDVVATIPHDPDAFTQGLVVHDGRLYEGTGQYGESTLRRIDLATGRVEQIDQGGNRPLGDRG